MPEVSRLHAESYGVLWAAEVARSHAPSGLAGGPRPNRSAHESRQSARRATQQEAITTKSDPAAVKPGDLMNRQFTALAPRRLWVADVTDVATWSGFANVAFVTDLFPRRIVGPRVASTTEADVLPLQALDIAAWHAADDLARLVHHADHGSNYPAVAYTDRILA